MGKSWEGFLNTSFYTFFLQCCTFSQHTYLDLLLDFLSFRKYSSVQKPSLFLFPGTLQGIMTVSSEQKQAGQKWLYHLVWNWCKKLLEILIAWAKLNSFLNFESVL
jgi:hypothetical protein